MPTNSNPAVLAQKTANESAPLSRAAEAVRTARGWRQRGLAFGAGAVSTLAFAPFFAWPVLFATFPVLAWMIDGAGRETRPARAAAFAAWWFGFGYFFAGLLWIGEAFLVEAEIFAWLLPFAVTLLPAGMALYWGLAGAVAQRFWPRSSPPRPSEAIARMLVLAASLGVCEWLRGHLFTGFPWNTPGLALTMPLPLMQAAGVFGIYGLGLWAVFICTLPLVLLADAERAGLRRAGLLAASLAGGPLLIAFILGSWHLSAPQPPAIHNVKLRIVQPSVPQRDKWIGAKQKEIFADHLALSKQDPDGTPDDLAGITHLIWPEASMPFGPLDHPEALAAIGQLLPPNVYLLAGALRQERDEIHDKRLAYNSLIAFGAGGEVLNLYDKVHLVPFGEYLPFQSALEAIGLQNLTRQRGGFSKGPTPKPLLFVPGLPPISPIICYEAIFPGEIAGGDARPGVIVIVTNDGWFGNSTGPYQHFHQARVRAVEQGLPVIRSANNGISGVIDPQGRILALLPMNARGSIDSPLPAERAPPVYARWGDRTFWLNVFFFIAAAWCLKRLQFRRAFAP